MWTPRYYTWFKQCEYIVCLVLIDIAKDGIVMLNKVIMALNIYIYIYIYIVYIYRYQRQIWGKVSFTWEHLQYTPLSTLPWQLQFTFLRFTALPGNSTCEARAKWAQILRFTWVKLTDYPPHLKLPELRVNSSLFNVVNESSFETVN